MKRRIHLGKPNRLLGRPVLIALLAVVLVLLVATSAFASGHRTSSIGSCDPGPWGASKLEWWGFNFWDWGHTWSYLWHWDSGSVWGLRSTGYNEAGGSSNATDAGSAAVYESGSWDATGNHQASFFPGTEVSGAPDWICP